MAKFFCGEAEIVVAGRGYVLRPSHAALYAMEYRTGKSLEALLTSLGSADLGIILEEGLKSAGEVLASPAEIGQELASALRHFLRQALCAEEGEPIIPIDWPERFKIAVGMLGRPVEEFWRMTPMEYALMLEGFLLLHPSEAASPPSQESLAELIKKFPDYV